MLADLFRNGKPERARLFLLIPKLRPQRFIGHPGLVRHDRTRDPLCRLMIPFCIFIVLIVHRSLTPSMFSGGGHGRQLFHCSKLGVGEQVLCRVTMPEGKDGRKLPQVAEIETPRRVDVGGECLVYDETGVYVPVDRRSV
jgi:hypothetical protein